MQAPEESFEKFNEKGSNTVFNAQKVMAKKPTLLNSVFRLP